MKCVHSLKIHFNTVHLDLYFSGFDGCFFSASRVFTMVSVCLHSVYCKWKMWRIREKSEEFAIRLEADLSWWAFSINLGIREKLYVYTKINFSVFIYFIRDDTFFWFYMSVFFIIIRLLLTFVTSKNPQ